MVEAEVREHCHETLYFIHKGPLHSRTHNSRHLYSTCTRSNQVTKHSSTDGAGLMGFHLEFGSSCQLAGSVEGAVTYCQGCAPSQFVPALSPQTQEQDNQIQRQRHGSVFTTTCCYSRRPESCAQRPWHVVRNSDSQAVTPGPGDRTSLPSVRPLISACAYPHPEMCLHII